MKEFKIDAMQKGKSIPADRPNHPTDFCDYYKAENEEAAKALWESDNQEFTGGALYIVRITQTK